MIPLLMAGAIGLVVSLLGTRYLIDWLRAHRVGQPIHDDVQVHSGKAGTPTMGGVAIVVAAVAGYGAAHFNDGLVFTRSGVLVMLTIAAVGGRGRRRRLDQGQPGAQPGPQQPGQDGRPAAGGGRVRGRRA